MKKRLLALVLAVSLVSTLIPSLGNVSTQAEETSTYFGDKEEDFITRESGYELPLNGQWTFTALTDDDETVNTQPYEFDKDLNKLKYMDNPQKTGNKLSGPIQIPTAVNGHSVYRSASKGMFSTKVKLKDIDKSSFYIDFDGTNWITSVFVNGVWIGGKKGTRMPWNCPIPQEQLVADQDGYITIDIVIKGIRYAIDPAGTMIRNGATFPDKSAKLSDFIDVPWNEEAKNYSDPNEGKLIWVSNIMPSSKGDSHAGNWGITDNLSIIATSNSVQSAYVDDVFVQPNVVDKETKTVTKTKKVTKTVKNKKGKKVKRTTKQQYKVEENTFTKNKKFTTQVTLVNPTKSEKKVTVVPSVQKVDLKKDDKGNLTSEKVYGTDEKIDALKAQEVTLAAGETKVVEFKDVAWADAELWWPDINYDTAQMYNFKATIKEGDQVADVYNQQFGFRDIEIDGKHIRVNGVIRNFWNGLGSLNGSSLEEMMKNVKAHNDRFERFGSDLGLAGILSNFYGYTPNPTEQMDVLDFIGMPVRVSSQIDGMMISHYPYYASKEAAAYGVKEGVNTTLFENFQLQIEDMVKEHRNHPANIVYSLENEFMYITVALAFTPWTEYIEEAVKQYMSGPCVALDPTRPYMLDGGGAAMDNSDPIYCHHYAEEQGIIKNSEKLVTTKTKSQQLWLYDEKRPYAAGEVAFFSGEFDTHSWIGGYNAGNSQGDALEAYAKYMKTLYNKYRWNEVAITCPWTTSAGTSLAHPALEPLAVIRETYTSSFFANKGVSLKVKVFNDTFSDSKITAKWSLIDSENNQVVQSGTWPDLTIEPGTGVTKTIKIEKISGLTDRKDYILRLESSQASSKNEAEGVEFAKTDAFSEDQVLTAFPKAAKTKLKKKVYVYNTSKAVNKYLKSIGIKTLKVKKYLKKKVVVKKKGKTVYVKKKNKKTGKVTKVKKVKIKRTYMNPSNYKKKFLKKKNLTVLVGADGPRNLAGEGDQAALTLYARAGGRVIFLEQTNSEKMLYSEADTKKSVPIKVYPFSDNSGTYSANYAFGQGFDRPLLSGLQEKDLSMWNGSGKTTAEVWGVPTGSARSWINVGSKMQGVALLEVPVDKGVVIATQMRVGAKINKEPVAQIMLKNMLTYAEAYEVPSSKVGVPANTDEQVMRKLESTGATIEKLSDVASGLSITKTKIMIIEANEANLKVLNEKKADVDNYVADGGWIIFTNLTDDAAALEQYNKLLGTKHIVRPFRLESTNAYSDWTTIGLSTSDYKLYSKRMIAQWSNLSDISQYTWTYGIDATNDLTPFFDYEAFGKGNKLDLGTMPDRRYNAANICNYLSSDEHWFYQAGAWLNADQLPSKEKPLSFDTAYGLTDAENPDKEFFTLKHEEALESITYRQATSGNVAFSGMSVIVDGKKVVDNHKIELVGSEQTIPLNGVKANNLDIQFTGYYTETYDPGFSMAGIESLYINRQTPQWIIDSNCKALNSSGTLVKYERGEGGFMLNNVNLKTENAAFKEIELSTSIDKKVGIFTKILTNLGAQFKAEK